MLAASSSPFRIQLLSVLSSFGTSQHEELSEVSQSLRSFSLATLLDKWNPQHTACPCDFLAVWGKGVKHTLNCMIFCQAKFIVITFFSHKCLRMYCSIHRIKKCQLLANWMYHINTLLYPHHTSRWCFWLPTCSLCTSAFCWKTQQNC